MDESKMKQEDLFIDWATENLGQKTGIWYKPYLEKIGQILSDAQISNEFNENFFEYRDYESFMPIYQAILGESEEILLQVIAGKKTAYSVETKEKRNLWKNYIARTTYKAGIRSKPDNFGGIPDLGVVLRSYLKFTYYKEHSDKIYPGRHKYWIIGCGKDGKFKDEFLNKDCIMMGWKYLENLNEFYDKSDIAKAISQTRKNADSMREAGMVLDFSKEMKKDDIIYLRNGNDRVIARGRVKSDYFFDETAEEYPQCRKVEWTNKGVEVALSKEIMDPLLELKENDSLIHLIERSLLGLPIIVKEKAQEDPVDEANLFKDWLQTQENSTGAKLDEKTVNNKIASLKDLEKFYQIEIFGEQDVQILQELKEGVLLDDTYTHYVGVIGSALEYYIRFIETKPVNHNNKPYTEKDFLKDVYVEKETLDRLQSLLKNKKNLILKGAPGVGKTYIAKRLAYAMMNEKDDQRVQMVQFHQSYSYEDFIEGYRPNKSGDGFSLHQGPFVQFARMAERDKNREYFFIIDEINRGNMSKIFGELMMLIENDKRGESLRLLYSNDKFSVPKNLYIIGMMNTADRSLALLDYALRRRFAFFEVQPAFENDTFKKDLPEDPFVDKVIQQMILCNENICQDLDSGFQIGHSYFTGQAMKDDPKNRIEEILEYEIIPQLDEYWFDDSDKAKKYIQPLRDCYE